MLPDQLESLAARVDGSLAIELTRELVQTPSVVGEEAAIGNMLVQQMHELGLQHVRTQEVHPDRFNVIGELDFGPGPTIVLTGHMDTKPVCVGWKRDPYAGDLESDRLYGHAIMDMKAGIAGQLAALKTLMSSSDGLRGRALAVFVCDHMGQQDGARAYFSQYPADMAVLGELTDNRVAIGHRGRYYWDITTLGRAAHTCHKYEAINAIAKAAELLLEIERIRLEPELDDPTRALFGRELYMSVGRIYGGLPPEGPSMIPDNCTIRVDSRPQPGVGPEVVERSLQEAIERVAQRDPDFRCRMVLADQKAPHLISVDAPIVRFARRAVEAVQGDADVVGMSWLGDTATFGQWVPTVIYGPGREPVYMPNEYLDLDDIVTAAQVYALTVALALSNEEDAR